MVVVVDSSGGGGWWWRVVVMAPAIGDSEVDDYFVDN